MGRLEPNIATANTPRELCSFGGVTEHFHDPRNRGTLPDFNQLGRAGASGQHGYVTITLRVEDGVVQDARHESHGCRFTIACGSLLTEWIKHRSIVECRELTADEVTNGLEGLPVYKRHCPGLVLAALHAALND